MPKQVVLLSGPVSSGKTTLAESLRDRFGLIHIKTLDELRKLSPRTPATRDALQKLGARFDKKTRGAWVREAVDARLSEFSASDESRVVVDAVRIQEQADEFRAAYGRKVIHIHLTAPVEILEERYEKRIKRKRKPIDEFDSYAKVRAHPVERKVDELRHIADVVVDTTQCTREDVVTRVASHVGLYGREYIRLVDVVVGGQYGSEGKGQVCAYLASDYDVLVRVGGPNAGHSVFEEPTPYVFHHLPSGTRANRDALIVIGPGATINVPELQREIAECEVDVSRLCIDKQVMIIEDADRMAESALRKSIGSTQQGVGSATSRRILGRGECSVKLARDVPDLRPYVRETCQVLEECFSNRQRVLLEGTQGTGLSLYHGVYPYVTSRDTTVAGCLAEAGISPSRVRKVVMVCRTYPIRVENPPGGTSGPMSQEISFRVVSERSGLDETDLTNKEKTSTTRRNRRVGEFEWSLFRRAATLNAPTDIALTFTDYLDIENRHARRYEQLQPDTIRFIEEIERIGAAPVSLISTCFEHRSIIDRRAW